MLGKFVKVRVTFPMHAYNKRFGYRYKLNYGIVEGGNAPKNTIRGAYIMGINHPVRNFDGRVIAIVRRKNGKLRGSLPLYGALSAEREEPV